MNKRTYVNDVLDLMRGAEAAITQAFKGWSRKRPC